MFAAAYILGHVCVKSFPMAGCHSLSKIIGMSTFTQKVKARYTVVAANAPQWNEGKVESILKSHIPLTDADMKELYKAIDYYEYLNDTLDLTWEGDKLDDVTEQLERIAERMEGSGRLAPKEKEGTHHPQH